jgi:DNA polymerase (family 10)
MDNSTIADYFSLLAKLMDIHGENSFKSKSYSSAAFTIDKLPMALLDVPANQLAGIKGIGDSTAKKIIELLQTGELSALNEMVAKTPAGILEMLQIKGLGPKKIATIWKEMEIETIGELLYACKENRLKMFKGFGEKTQQQVQETIEFYFNSKGSYLYAQVEALLPTLQSFLEKIFPEKTIQVAGAFAKQHEIIEQIEFVVDEKLENLRNAFQLVSDFEIVEEQATRLLLKSQLGFHITLHACETKGFTQQVFELNGHPDFVTAFYEQHPNVAIATLKNEAAIFEAIKRPFIPAYLRESASVLSWTEDALTSIIQPNQIKGIIHSHSNWSDGSNTLEEMAIAAKEQGLEYLVISDHSKSAFYANGLKEDRIKEQHQYIAELNQQLAPFKIFKSIESDILNDGSLDYSNSILGTFDLVIASVHSNLKMPEEKAMQRLITAIENPYTTILGHMTGRLLLSRKGYPVDHKKIIDACAANQVVIELNAHPSRLDIDWRYISYALEKGVLISIDPDAHAISGYADTRYGVLVAQKAGLTAAQNLSSFNLAEFEQFLQKQQLKKG